MDKCLSTFSFKIAFFWDGGSISYSLVCPEKSIKFMMPKVIDYDSATFLECQITHCSLFRNPFEPCFDKIIRRNKYVSICGKLIVG